MNPLPPLEPRPGDPAEGLPARSSVAAQLARTVTELEARLAEQRALLRALLDAEGPLAAAANRPACHYLDCPRLRGMRHALVDAVQVLEETRRSFKSRQLEALRRRLVAVLVDA